MEAFPTSLALVFSMSSVSLAIALKKREESYLLWVDGSSTRSLFPIATNGLILYDIPPPGHIKVIHYSITTISPNHN